MRTTARLLLLAVASLVMLDAVAQTPVSVYHEATCPAVDRSRMPRMKRSEAIAAGLLPAPDCHSRARVLVLGPSAPDASPSPPAANTYRREVQVREYTRKDGTTVGAHTRSAPRKN